MNIKRTLLGLFLTISALNAQVPPLLEYDGLLSGNITGNRTMGVKLYNASQNGTLLYKETIGTVKVTSGQFYFQYGQNGTAGNGTTPTQIGSVLTGSQNWLAVTVNGTELAPRERLLSVPFALRSADAQKTISDLNNVVDAVGRVVTALGGNASNLVSNPQATIATVQNQLKDFLDIRANYKVISLSGNLSFGNKAAGSTSSSNLTISNTGFGRLNVRGITYPEGFSGNWSGVIPAGGMQNVTVNFKPTIAKNYGGNVTLNTDATSGTGLVSCSGIGVAPTPTPSPTPTPTPSLPVVTTLAGNGQYSFLDGNGTAASFFAPTGVAVASSGNIYVADTSNQRIRKVTPAGMVTTLAGNGAIGSVDGTGTGASFNFPQGIAVDSQENCYVSDTNNNKIRKISPSGDVTTLVGSGVAGSTDGVGANSSFNKPYGVAVDRVGNVYVGDGSNQKIRKITPQGVVTTLAGSGEPNNYDGISVNASFYHPNGIAVDGNGNVYVVAKSGNIRKISPMGIVTTVASRPPDSNATYADGVAGFNNPEGVAVDKDGNLYVADSLNNRIRKITIPQ